MPSTLSKQPPTCVGVDGCKGGWFAVLQDGEKGELQWAAHSSFSEVLAWAPDSAIVAIDIPIGLSDSGARDCDVAAKKMLKWPRSASVFSAPIKQTLSSLDPTIGDPYRHACDINRSVTGKAISKQAFNILGKIAEVDGVLAKRPAVQKRVFEIHPELSFMALKNHSGAEPRGLVQSKHTIEGFNLRRALLFETFGARVDDVLATRLTLTEKVSKDDILDALACLWSARRISRQQHFRLPQDAATHSHGSIYY